MPIIIIIIMLQIISGVIIAQWLKLLTSNRVLYDHDFESQTETGIPPPPPPPPTPRQFFIFIFNFFFVCFWLALFPCFLPYQVCTLRNPRIISRDSQMSDKIVVQKSMLSIHFQFDCHNDNNIGRFIRKSQRK